MRAYRLPLLLIATLLLAASAVAAACGGVGVTTEEYFSQLQTTFDNTQERYAALGEEPLEPTAFDENAPIDERIRIVRERLLAIAAVQRDFLDELGELDPPADLRDAHEAYLDAANDKLARETESYASEALEQQLSATSLDEIRQANRNPALGVATDREEQACLELWVLARQNEMSLNIGCGLE